MKKQVKIVFVVFLAIMIAGMLPLTSLANSAIR